MAEIGYLYQDPIIIYIDDKHEEIGIEPPLTRVFYDQQSEDDNNEDKKLEIAVSNTFMDYYLFEDEGRGIIELYKILIFFEQNPPPQHVLDELDIQISRSFDPVKVIQEMSIYISELNHGIFPEEFVDIFRLFKKFGYEIDQHADEHHTLICYKNMIQHLSE